MARERRSLWGSISQSKKVNKLSIKAALLYTWAIPHFDDEGYQAGEPRDLKINVVPFREDIPLSEIKELIIEIVSMGLWNIYHIDSTAFIQDPVWNDRQSFKGLHKYPSKIKKIIGDTPRTLVNITSQGVSVHLDPCIREVKIREDKIKEVKRSTPEQNPISLSLKEVPNPTQEDYERKKFLKEQAKALGVKI